MTLAPPHGAVGAVRALAENSLNAGQQTQAAEVHPSHLVKFRVSPQPGGGAEVEQEHRHMSLEDAIGDAVGMVERGEVRPADISIYENTYVSVVVSTSRPPRPPSR